MTQFTDPLLSQTSSSSTSVVPLRKRSDFLRVQKSALRWVTPGFVMTCEPAVPDQPIRIGFTITKKIGSAVVRNRIRRRFRHLMHELLPQLDVMGWTIVLLARPDALKRDYADLGKDVRWALRKLQAQCTATSHTPSATA